MTVIGNYWCTYCGREHRYGSKIHSAHEYFIRGVLDDPNESETPFRLYRLDPDGTPKCAVAADDVSLADALLAQHKAGYRVDGIMYRPVVGEEGVWLVNPFGPPAVESGRLTGATKGRERHADE